ncbi:hypothetical protein OY671_010590, partial [Metschnikowia pulcherrima]
GDAAAPPAEAWRAAWTAGQRVGCSRKKRDLDSQTLAALGAASVQDGAASAGLHAHAETMGALAAGNGRLVVRRDSPGGFSVANPVAGI